MTPTCGVFFTSAVNCTDSDEDTFALLGFTCTDTAAAGVEEDVLLCIGAACNPEQAMPEIRVRRRKETAQ